MKAHLMFEREIHQLPLSTKRKIQIFHHLFGPFLILQIQMSNIFICQAPGLNDAFYTHPYTYRGSDMSHML